MSFDYAKMKSTASRLLKKFGKPITIQVLTGEADDPVTMSKVSTYTNSTGYGVTMPIKSNEVDGSLILASDVRLIIENIDLEPVVGSLYDGYRVVSVMPLKPANTNLIYTCILRK